MKTKRISRREFIIGCGVLSFGASGALLTGCGATVTGITNDIKLGVDEYSALLSKGYINLATQGAIIFYNEEQFYAYSNRCPHEGAELKAQDNHTIKCSRHTRQNFDNKGISNKAETKTSLKALTVEKLESGIKLKV